MVLVATLAALLVPAAAAHAGQGTVTISGGIVTVTFGSTDDALLVNSTVSMLELQENSGSGTMVRGAGAAGCAQPTASRVDCPFGAVDELRVRLGDGADFAEMQTFPTSVHLDLDAGGGDDPQILGSSGDDDIRGGTGDDSIFSRGGDDNIDGGPGNDELAGGDETDDIHGGDGFDFIDLGGATLSARVTLDDVADDGPAGEHDNFHSDVEDVDLTSGNDLLRGSAAGNVIFAGGGDDDLDAGGGVDRVDAGDGNDVVFSRDGLAEVIDCGPGTDVATVDDVDVLDGCETVSRSSIFQTDIDGDGAARPVDCNDADPALHPGAVDVLDDGIDQDCSGADATNPDRDADGVPRPFDCDDGNARAAPGKREQRGNRVDEDCNGRAEPFLLVENSVTNAWSTQGAVTRNLTLGVRDLRKGMKVQVRCGGGGCPFARKSRTVKKRTRLLDLHPLLAGAALRAGARVEVRIARRQAIGKVVRFTMRSGAIPRSTPLCLPPGKTRPRGC